KSSPTTRSTGKACSVYTLRWAWMKRHKRRWKKPACNKAPGDNLMNITCTRMAGLVLAFGFFFGCSASKPTADNPGTYSSNHLSKDRFNQRMKVIDEQLQSDRYNPALYYEKGTLLIK